MSTLDEAGRLVDNNVSPASRTNNQHHKSSTLVPSSDRRRQSDRSNDGVTDKLSPPALVGSNGHSPSSTESSDHRKWSLPAAAKPANVARRLSKLALFGGGGGGSTSSSSGYGSRKGSKARSGDHLDAQECYVQ